MKRLFIISISILAIATLFTGCNQVVPEQPLVVSINPDSGHPPFDVTITVAGKTGGKYIYQPTGQEPTESTENTFKTTVNAWPWKCPVTWIDGDNMATATAQPHLINERPIAHDLWLSNKTPQKGEDVRIDLRYLEHGCLNGMPLTYSGIEDPNYQHNGYSIENDGFTYNVKIFDKETGEQETVFKSDRTPLGDEFIESAYMRWFPGCNSNIPPYPFGPTCLPLSTPVNPTPLKVVVKEVHVYVKEFGNIYHWVYYINTYALSCSN